MSKDKPKPADSDDRRPDFVPAKKRHRLNVTLAGLPELDYFESDEKREMALAQVAKEGRRPATSGLFWFNTLLISGAVAVVIMIVFWFGQFVTWPSELKTGIRIAATFLVVMVLIRKIRRQEFPSLLRKKLIEQGVPMCLKCGYNLRGQQAESTRCPECGTAINEPSKRILAANRPGDPLSPGG